MFERSKLNPSSVCDEVCWRTESRISLKELPFIEPIHSDLKQVEKLLRAHPPGQHEVIGVALEHLTDGGGKRVRPALMLLSAYLCDADMDRAIFAAAAVELLHTATLVHDDLIDSSLIRRGVKTLNADWAPAATILTGDYIFARAAYLVSQADNVLLTQRFAETLMIICNGEIRQLFDGKHSQANRQAFRRYEQRIYAKTASLLALSAEGGAILAEAPDDTVQALRTYGEQLGMAFQIVDDVLDFVADEDDLGKPTGSDLSQGLVTLPTLLFLEENPEHPSVRQALMGDQPQDVIREAVQAIVDSQAIKRAIDIAREHAESAQATLDNFPPVPYRAALLDLADFTVNRRF